MNEAINKKLIDYYNDGLHKFCIHTPVNKIVELKVKDPYHAVFVHHEGKTVGLNLKTIGENNKVIGHIEVLGNTAYVVHENKITG